MNNKEKETLVLARLAAQILDEKKGDEVRILRGVQGAPAEYFVLATGNVPSHVSALSDAVYENVKKATGMAPHKIEGYQNAEWILMDYFDVVVHIFQKEKRAFYRLDELWSDGKEVAIKSK